jgi:hypothetical protein
VGLRDAKNIVFTPTGVTDSLDGTNAPPGSMRLLQNLVPSYGTSGVYTPRPAGTTAINFSSINPNGIVSALIVVGTRAYGWISSSTYAGKDQPFCYDLTAASFITLTGVTSALLPATQASTGDWTPPVVCAVTNSLILFLHAGYAGGANPYFGWLDISSFSQTVLGNTTSGSPVITGVVTSQGTSAPILQGIQPGQIVTGAGLPAGAYVKSCVNGTFSLNTTGNVNATTTISSVANTTGVIAGMSVTGPAFLAGTYVTNVSGATVTVNQAAITTATGTSINFSGGGTVTLSANASASANNVTLTATGGTFAAPLWGAGNTNTNPLSQVPIACAGFNGRAYFGLGPYLVYSDVLKPLQVSFASQALVIGDNTPITAITSVPLTSQLTGGIQQSLTVFKGAAALTQITGDAATSNLAQNTVAGSVGTLAPNSTAQTPYGTAFMAVDGLRVLGLTGTLSEPIGTNGAGICVPFLNALYPSRMSADYAEDVYRVTVQNAAAPGEPTYEYWFNFQNQQWTGPHTCAMRMISAYSNGADFLGAPYQSNGVLWQSGVIPIASSVYVENGQQLTWTYQTSLLPDNREGSYNKVVQSSIALAILSSDTLLVSAVDDSGATLAAVNVSGFSGAESYWGAATWGSGVWGSASPYLRELPVLWPLPLIFRQASISVTGASNGDQQIGNVYAKVQPVGWNVALQ